MTPAGVLRRAAEILEAQEWHGSSAALFAAIDAAVGREPEQHELWAAAIELARVRAIPPERRSIDLLGNWAAEKGRTLEHVLEMLRRSDPKPEGVNR